MNTDDWRRITAGPRRQLIIETFSREFDTSEPSSAASRFESLLEQEPHKHLIVSGDIDGIVSAAMLARVAPDWRAIALVWGSEAIYLHPDFAGPGFDLTSLFGVDVFGYCYPSVSNHPVYFGTKRIGGSSEAAAASAEHDQIVAVRAVDEVVVNPSLWAGIQGGQPSAWNQRNSAGYRYPLGTAQILLAVLEVIDRSPRLFDREYLPWLVAHCDGGLDTIREYPFNVPLWWSCMAAAVGPASLTEQLYQLAMNQRPTEFIDAVNRLRAEDRANASHVSTYLKDDWNVRASTPAQMHPVVAWLTSLSGWPDPFRDGSENLGDWVRKSPAASGHLLTTGLPGTSSPVESFKEGLRSSLQAVHTNFNLFDGRQRLSWVMPWEEAVGPTVQFGPSLSPGQPSSPPASGVWAEVLQTDPTPTKEPDA